jgi:tetratricopeptide (TPR) repeat protein
MHVRQAFAVFQILLAMLFLAFAWASYSPGLHGSFLFDDFANLPPLGEFGPIDNWSAFWRFVTSGHADPLGRPLAMLSFLIDAQSWPADPLPFKRTNLLLHLCNGALLGLLLRQLGRATQPIEASRQDQVWRIDLAALLGAAFWLLHPLWISTTLYIVQREAMLPATFTLLGLVLWLQGRSALTQGKIPSGLVQIMLGLGVCTLLAILCKANGALLPVFALVIEHTILRQAESENSCNSYNRAMQLFAWLPAALISLYLTWEGVHGLLFGISSLRPWTMGQRLLTEPRVLMDYLTLLWAPRPFTAGLFNDQIHASTSLWAPITTLPALCTVAGLIAIALRLRKQRSALAAAILFYLVGQSLESSTIPLELYFEHRNYLPAMLMFWPLALWLSNAYLAPPQQPVDINLSPVRSFAAGTGRLLLAAAIMFGLATMTHAGAALWGNTRDQALVWARLNPDSPRAQANAAQVEMAAGQPALAVQRLQPLLSNNPDQVQIALNLLGAECLTGTVNPATLDSARTALASSRDPGSLLTSWFTKIIDNASKPLCPQLTPSVISSLLDSALTNPYFKNVPGRMQDIYYLKGLLALNQKKPDCALQRFNHALDLQVRAPLALQQAALLGASGYPTLGLAHLAHYESMHQDEITPDFGMPRVHAWILRKQRYWPAELARLHATLEHDATRQRTPQT